MATRNQRRLATAFKRKERLERELEACKNEINTMSNLERDNENWLFTPTPPVVEKHLVRLGILKA